MLALGEVLGPARSTAATDADFDVLPLAPVELQRRRVDRNGKVKIRLSLAGVRVSKCAVRSRDLLDPLTGQICLVQFRAEDLGTIWPECLHCFHAGPCCDAPAVPLMPSQLACAHGSSAGGPARPVVRPCIPRRHRPRRPDLTRSQCTPSSPCTHSQSDQDDVQGVCTAEGSVRGTGRVPSQRSLNASATARCSAHTA